MTFCLWAGLGRDGHSFEHLMERRETSGDVKKFID